MGKWCLANFTCQEVCQRGTVSGIIPNLATALVISQYFALDLSQKSCQTGGWKTGLPFTELGFKKGCICPAEQFFFSDLLFFLEVDSLSHMVPQAVDPSPNWQILASLDWFQGTVYRRFQYSMGTFMVSTCFNHRFSNRVIKTILMLEDGFSPVSTCFNHLLNVGSLQ